MTIATMFRKGIRGILARRDLVAILVERNLKIRYKSSALGFFWSLLVPVFMIVIYAIFLRVMKFDLNLPRLVTGILVWQFLGMCLGDSLHAVVGNANLVTKSAFPRVILPLSMVLANLINFLLSFAVLLVYLAFAGANFGAVGMLPFLLLTQLALCLGVSLIFSAANVFFRDVEHGLSMLMLAWFFLTPVIYDVSMVTGSATLPAWTHTAFFCNPMTGIVTGYRMALLSVPGPGAGSLALSAGIAWLILAAGLAVFRMAEPRFGDEL